MLVRYVVSNTWSSRTEVDCCVYSPRHAFAALRSDGEVVAWGRDLYGGDASSVQKDLMNIKEVYSSQSSFAALRSDGGLTIWGHQDDMLYDEEAQEAIGSHVAFVVTSKLAMTAVKDDGTYVTWGSPDHGGMGCSEAVEW